MINNKRRSVSDFIYEEIKKKIIELEFEPEQHLNEEYLTSQFKTSRTPLRQALYRLELENLVFRETNGRLHVAPVSINEAQEVSKVREVIEGLLTRESVEKMNDSILRLLDDTMNLMERAAKEGRNSDIVMYGTQFHTLLYSNSDNRTALQFLNQLKGRIARYRRVGGYKDPSYQSLDPVNEHQKILGTIKSGDTLKAEEMMRYHIRQSLNRTLVAIKHVLKKQ